MDRSRSRRFAWLHNHAPLEAGYGTEILVQRIAPKDRTVAHCPKGGSSASTLSRSSLRPRPLGATQQLARGCIALGLMDPVGTRTLGRLLLMGVLPRTVSP